MLPPVRGMGYAWRAGTVAHPRCWQPQAEGTSPRKSKARQPSGRLVSRANAFPDLPTATPTAATERPCASSAATLGWLIRCGASECHADPGVGSFLGATVRVDDSEVT